MDCDDKIKLEQEITVLPEVKIEPPDYFSVPAENGIRCFEKIFIKEEFENELIEQPIDQLNPFDAEIELGNEFKTEFPIRQESSYDHSYKNYSFKYCLTCNETSETRQIACLKCRTILKFKCKECLKVFAEISAFDEHVNGACIGKPKFFCDLCDHKAHFKCRIAEHIKSRHKLLFPRSKPNNENHSLKYCTTCDENWELSEKRRQMTCHKCKSTFKFKCKNCSKLYVKFSGLNDHVNICDGKPKSNYHESNQNEHIESRLAEKTQSENENYSLKYCTTCYESWKLSEKKREKACHRCKTIFKFKCAKCAKLYTKVSSLYSHINSVCNEKPRYYCDYCDHQFYLKYRLAEHVQVKHKSLQKSLPLNKNFSGLNGIPGYCTNCCKTEINFTENCGICSICQSNLVFKCIKCSKEFESRKSLQNHIYICNQELKFCSYCDFKTRYKRSLIDHTNSMHLIVNPNANKCTQCGISNATKYRLREHLKFCGKRKKQSIKFSCAHCKYKSFEKNNLSLHIRSRHLIGDSNTINCINCGLKFLKLSGLKIHLKYSCPKTEEKLEPPLLGFSCSFCGSKYKHKVSLARHVKLRHSSMVSYVNKCKNCKKSFSTTSGFTRHTRNCGKTKDTQMRFFFCDNCDFRCATKRTITGHMLSKHMNITFKCKFCGKRYRSEFRLNQHAKRSHLIHLL